MIFYAAQKFAYNFSLKTSGRLRPFQRSGCFLCNVLTFAWLQMSTRPRVQKNAARKEPVNSATFVRPAAEPDYQPMEIADDDAPFTVSKGKQTLQPRQSIALAKPAAKPAAPAAKPESATPGKAGALERFAAQKQSAQAHKQLSRTAAAAPKPSRFAPASAPADVMDETADDAPVASLKSATKKRKRDRESSTSSARTGNAHSAGSNSSAASSADQQSDEQPDGAEPPAKRRRETKADAAAVDHETPTCAAFQIVRLLAPDVDIFSRQKHMYTAAFSVVLTFCPADARSLTPSRARLNMPCSRSSFSACAK